MTTMTRLRIAATVFIIIAATIGMGALETQAAPHGKHCARGVKACSAEQVGQPCDPNNLSVICSAQADGSYCCLAYAP